MTISSQNQPAFRSPLRALSLTGLVALGISTLGISTLVPACNVTSCADTNTCNGENEMGGASGQDEDGDMMSDMSSGGAGGADSEALSCPSGEVACDGSCIEPASDLSFCGASGSCEGEDAGQACSGDDLCVDGVCIPECGDNQLVCDGACIDPMSNNDFCGAVEFCDTGERCSANEVCAVGRCREWEGASEADLNVVLPDTVGLSLGMDADGRAVIGGTRETNAVDAFTSVYDRVDGTWSAPRNAEWHWEDVQDANIAVNESGKTEFVWRQTNPLKEVWSMGRASSGSTWTSADQRSTVPADTTAFGPRVAIDNAGATYLAWYERVGATQRAIRLAIRSAEEGATYSAPISVAPIGELDPGAQTPQIGLLGPIEGRSQALIVYRETIGGQHRLVYSVAQEASSSAGLQVTDLAASGDVKNYETAGNENGAAAVVWSVEAGAGIELWANLYSEGEFLGATQIAESETGTIDSLAVTVDRQGVAHVVWRENEAEQQLNARTFNPLSGSWSDEVSLGQPNTAIGKPAIDVDSFGNVQAAWIAHSAGIPSVWTSRRNASAGNWDEPSLLEESSDALGHVRLVMNDEGRVMVVWWNLTNPGHLGWNYFL